jgi:Na+/proline symporter
VALIIGPVMPREYTMPAAIVVLGVLTVIYTYRGGMKAVVWTELLQASIYLVGGISAIILLGQSVDGGWTTILDRAGAAGKLQAIDWYTGFDRPHTMFAGLIGGAFLAMASHGADQIIVQRLLSSRSLKQAQVAIIGSGIAVFAQMALFLMVGLGLWWARRVLGQSLSYSSMVAMGMSCPNSGFMGYPIILLSFGPVAGVALALNMVVENFLLLPLLLAIAEAQGRKRTFLAVPDGLSATFAALPGTPMSRDQWTLLKAGNTVAEGALGLADLGIEAKPLGLFLDKWMLRFRKHGRFGAANERAKAR